MAGPILETKGIRLIFEKNSQKNVLKIFDIEVRRYYLKSALYFD